MSSDASTPPDLSQRDIHPIVDNSGYENRIDSGVSDQCTDDATIPSDPEAIITALARPIMEGKWTLGMVVGLIDKNGSQIISFGRATLADETPPNENTFFEIGSATMTFTSLLFAQLLENKTLMANTPAQELLPEDKVSMPTKNGIAITLDQLATHTSGLPNSPDNLNPISWKNPFVDYHVEQLYAFLNQHQLQYVPGTAWEFSNLGYALLGHALSLKLSDNYEYLLKSQIISPLGLEETAIQLTEEQKKRMAQGYSEELLPTGTWDYDVFAPAGALRSTAKDLLHYLAHQIKLKKSDISSAIAATQSVQCELSTREAMGLGWLIFDAHYYWISGKTGGFQSFLGFDSLNQRGVVVLANAVPYQMPGTLLGKKILRVLGGDEAYAPVDLPLTLELSSTILDRYVGNYRAKLSSGDYNLTITRKDDSLYLVSPEGEYKMFAEEENVFYLRIVPVKLTFLVIHNDQGVFDTLIFKQEDIAVEFSRIFS